VTTARGRVLIEGVLFDRLREQEVHHQVLSSLDRSVGGLLMTPNVDILRQLQDRTNADLTEAASLVLADGRPVIWASRLLGNPLPERVTGSSLIWTLSEAAARVGRRVMLIGGDDGVAERAAKRLQQHYPALGEVAWHYPPFGFEDRAADLQRLHEAVRAAKPDIVFIGLGFPRQERLGLALLEAFPGAWFAGCGGSIAMLAGDLPRAPAWLQDKGLEWIYRLALEPRRLARRYLIDDIPYALGILARAFVR
jgi:N-acetylglucosaminyldiphosphoundecaprenol N-acetyl-beta-D-mannosaminyltransferase